MSILQTTSYAVETYRYAGEYQSELANALGFEAYSRNKHILDNTSKLSCAGFSILGSSAYDMVVPPVAQDREERHWSRLHAGMAIHFSDVTDDIIDNPYPALLPLEKEAQLRCMLAVIRDGKEDNELESRDPGWKAAVAIGGYLQSELGDNFLFKKVLDDYPRIEGSRSEHPDFDETLTYVESLGDSIGELLLAPTSSLHEVPDGTLQAYRYLGRYGLVLDHAYEVADDLKEGSSSLVTVQLGEVWNLNDIRVARRECLKIAEGYISKGIAGLPDREQAIYSAIKTMLDTRYRFCKRIADTCQLLRITRPNTNIADIA